VAEIGAHLTSNGSNGSLVNRRQRFASHLPVSAVFDHRMLYGPDLILWAPNYSGNNNVDNRFGAKLTKDIFSF
jgi:hypothetical protein